MSHILVATDFSECALRAIDAAVELAQCFDSELTLLHVWELPPVPYGAPVYWPADVATPIRVAAEARLERAGRALRQRFPRATTLLREGQPWREILAASAALGADLTVVGSHGRHGLCRAVLGSVAERVVQHSSIPVLTVHASASADRGVPR